MFGFGTSGNSTGQNASSQKYTQAEYGLRCGMATGTSDIDYLLNTFAPNTMKKIDAIYNRNPQYEAALKQAQEEKSYAKQEAMMWHSRYVEAISRYGDLLAAYSDLAQAKNVNIDQAFKDFDEEATNVINNSR